ncbi:hypothetical protein [Aureimonas sp. Leaf454]|uniref:hypothetical protein n=1 Tax=Aureimonas sp. Leaf454 TaxID=1736381 RepID=UPI0012E3C625|nr:hypothetical protein [Aureimonas sp. Leaf454]
MAAAARTAVDFPQTVSAAYGELEPTPAVAIHPMDSAVSEEPAAILVAVIPRTASVESGARAVTRAVAGPLMGLADCAAPAATPGSAVHRTASAARAVTDKMPGVFTWKPGTKYKDRIESEYRFTSRYDGLMEEVGLGWVVFHRSRRGDDNAPSAYVGVGEVHSVENLTFPIGMRVARIRNFLAFDPPVLFLNGNINREETLRVLPRTSVGPHTQGNPIRPLSNEDFGAIVRVGLADLFDGDKTALLDLDDPDVDFH